MSVVLEYQESNSVALFGGHKFRLDKLTGYYLSSRKIGDKRKRLHVCVWESHNGAIPNGMVVHHKDGNKANNSIDNLTLMTISTHSRLHMQERVEEQYEQMVENLEVNARPKAIEWHKSKSGSEWHKQHYERMKHKLHKEQVKNCEYCGCEYTAKSHRSKFCSNKCKSNHRRDSGVDDVTKTCEKCGKEYIANKYTKTSKCKLCKGSLC